MLSKGDIHGSGVRFLKVSGFGNQPLQNLTVLKVIFGWDSEVCEVQRDEKPAPETEFGRREGRVDRRAE
jgi:hypothetical protein